MFLPLKSAKDFTVSITLTACEVDAEERSVEGKARTNIRQVLILGHIMTARNSHSLPGSDTKGYVRTG
jgi:hypothetical protein